jgi:hypothetical protein
MELDFQLLDDLGLAAMKGRCPQIPDGSVRPTCLGALVELGLMRRSGASGLPGLSSIEPSAIRVSVASVFEGRASLPQTAGQVGSLCVRTRGPQSIDDQWTAFLFHAQQTAERAGLDKRVAQQLMGAIGELEDNIHLHSQATTTGFVAYRAYDDEFEFVVADQGVGILGSLKTCPDYQHLTDSGSALSVALQEGESRFGRGAQRGSGFRPLFIGLANLMGRLRFRSGDHILTIDGGHLDLAMARIQQRSPLRGFVVTVRCRNPA